MVGICRISRVFLGPKCFYGLTVGVAVALLLHIFLKDYLVQKVQLQARNYLRDVGRLKHLSLLINTTACKIPDLDLWDPEVVRFYVPPYFETKCDQKAPKWSTIDHTRNELVLDDDLLTADGRGFKFKELSCCYMTVSRTKDPKLKPDFDVDFSPCKAITTKRTVISEEFIVVECSDPGVLWNSLVYRMFHAVVPPETVVPRLELKKHRLSLEQMEVLPPNIIVLGLDSTTRLNFRRFMTQTIQTLESLGAVEMLGFNRVRSSTYANMLAHLTGYQGWLVEKLCFINNTSFHDGCPFIWSQLEEAGYLTTHLEDGNTLTYKKDGFRQVPTDFYIRPLFKAAFNHKYQLGRRDPLGNYMEPCTGYQLTNEVILDYVEATLDFAREQKRPIFNYAWASELTHEVVTGLSNLDGVYASALKRLHSKGHLDNSVLLVIGDHGYRHGPVRNTVVGLVESKLPVSWIYLPERIRKARPDWVEALEYNSKRLTSSFAVYWSVQLILKTFGPEGSYREVEDAKSLNTGEIIERHSNRQSFFEVASSSSCDDLGIEIQHCACAQSLTLAPDDALANRAAKVAVEDINKNKIDLRKCLPLSLVSVEGAVVTKNGDQEEGDRFMVTFGTKPGGAVYEAEITYWTSNKTFDTSRPVSVSRINKMTMEDVTCVKDRELELFCYCR